MFAVVLAHQGGWDEFLFAAGPVAFIVGLLWLANKRASRAAREAADAGGTPGDGAGESTGVRNPATPD